MANLIDYGLQSQAQVSPGWSMLGAMLGGIGNDSTVSPAYLNGARQGASIANIMAEGRAIQAKALGRESLAKQLDDEGDPDSAGAIRAGVDPQQVLAAKKIKAELALQAEAHSVLEGMGLTGDSKINRLTNLGAMRPTETVRVEGQNIVHPYDSWAAPAAPAPDQQDIASMFGPSAAPANPMAAAMGIQTTPQGLAAIREKDAEAAADAARGGAADALAAGRMQGSPLYDARVDALNRKNAGGAGSALHVGGRGSDALNAAIATAMDPNGVQSPNPSALGPLGNIVNSLASVFGQHGGVPAASSPPANARQAKDGTYYVPDPNRVGKWLKWQP